jgi:hypothetical protein
MGYALATFALLYISLGVAFRLSGIRFADFHDAIARPLFAALAMLLFVMAIDHLMQPNVTALLRLVGCISAGIVMYLAATFLVNRQQCIELIALTRSAVRPQH